MTTPLFLVPNGRADLAQVLILLSEKGKCAKSPTPELWWQPMPGGVDPLPAARARAAQLCDGCPVLDRCGWYALEAGEDEGVWGGLCEYDRATMRRGSSWKSRLYAALVLTPEDADQANSSHEALDPGDRPERRGA